jgi:general secretion pathway protein F
VTTSTLRVARADGVLTLTLDRPDQLNALTDELSDALAHELEQAAVSDDVRVVVIRGSGRAFCAGADISAVDGPMQLDVRALDRANRIVRAITRLDKPVLAGVQGVAAAVALLVAGAILLLRNASWRDRWHRLLLRTPVAGSVLRGLDTARFASTLAILTGSGAPLLRALETAAAVVWARPMRRAAHDAAGLVREGVSLARALASQRVFPPLLVHLVANGEQSGQLPAMLDRAAREQEIDVERRLTWLAALVQPLLIVFMGAIVLVMVLAVMLPIVSMNQLIR